MTDSSSVSSGLAALGVAGWVIAAPGTKTNSVGAEPIEVSGAAQTLEQGLIGGETNTTSQANNYDHIKHIANVGFLAASTAVQNVGALGTTPIFLMGLNVRAALTGTLTIVGFTDLAGAPITLVLPIGFVGDYVAPGNDIPFVTGCTMQLSVATDSGSVANNWNVRIAYRSIG